MKNTPLLVAMIIGIALTVSAALLSSAIKDYGRSLEKAAPNSAFPLHIPSDLTLRLVCVNQPLRLQVTEKP